MARNNVTVALAVGQTISPVAYSQGLTLVGIYFDANYSGTAAELIASLGNPLTGANSISGTVYSGGSAQSYTVAAGCYLPISADLISNGIDSVQVKSGTTQATNPSNITFVFK